MDDPSVAPVQYGRRRWRVGLLAGTVVVAAALGVLWFGISPSVPRGPVRLVRNEAGELVLEDPSGSSRPAPFEVQAAKIDAHDSLCSTSMSSRSDHSAFACRRVVILNQSDHLLAARVGQQLLEELKPLDSIRHVEYYPLGFAPEPGGLAPDVTVTFDLDKLTESTRPGSQKVEATFIITAGNMPPGLRNTYFGPMTPPLVQFDWNGKLEHTSTTRGVTSSAAEYKLAAADIAKEIGKALAKEFTSREEKERTLPELPQEFYPAYRKAPELPLAEFGKPAVVMSWHGLMNHNETLWRVAIDRPAADVVHDLRGRLESDGWKADSGSKESDPPHAYLKKEGATLVIYAPPPKGVFSDSPPKEPVVYVQYVDVMTVKELRAAIDECLAKDVPSDVLICFERHCSSEQRDRLLKVLQTRPARTPEVSLTLAGLYHRLKQDDQAREELARTCALLRTVAQYADLESKARNLAKELGDETLVKRAIEPGVLEELGFVELKAGASKDCREIGLDEPVYFFARAADGSLKTSCLRAIKSGTASDKSYQLAFVDSGEGSRSWGSGGSSHGFTVDDRSRAMFALERLGKTERFRLSTELVGR